MQPAVRFLVTLLPVVTGGLLCPSTFAGMGQASRTPGSQEAADRVRTKVVILKTSLGGTRGSATGILAGRRLVLTTDHAVKPGATVTAWVNGVSYRADPLVSYPDYDLAVLGLRAPNLLLKPAELAETTTALEPGEPLIVLAGPSQPANAKGDPDGRVAIPATYSGRVRLRLPNGSEGAMLQIQARVERGDSGSPVVRVRDGKVVGMLDSRELPDTAGVSRSAYAIPAEAFKPWLTTASERLAKRDAASEDFYLLGVLRR